MSNTLSTKLVYLDLKTIMENYRNPDFWEKSWLIFKSKELEIKWSIVNIDILNNKIESCISVSPGHITRGGKKFAFSREYTSKTKYSWYSNSCRPIPIDNSDYNQDTLNRNILGTILATVEEMEAEFARHTYEYAKASELEDEEKEKLKEIAEEFLDDEGVTNGSIRYAYIEKYVSDNSDSKYTYEVIANSKFRFFKTAYLHICSWFNNEEMFKKYETALKNFIPKKTIFKIIKKTKEMQSEDWVEEMKDQLESI